jgi:type III pantothenate kinase
LRFVLVIFLSTMILAIDAGNSTVAFGFFEGDEPVAVLRAESRTGATPDEYAAFLHAHIVQAGIAPANITGVVISSVVGPLVHVLFEAVKGITHATPMLISTRLKLPLKVRYSTPETLGGDRLASASAAYVSLGGPVVVVDFGTATTLTVVDGGGALLGGMIAPGLLTGYEALIARTSGLPRVGLTTPKDAIGVNTLEGLQSGIIYGHAAMAKGLIGRAESELKESAVIVATGGLAGMVVPHIGREVHTEPNLTLNGLLGIYNLNINK